MGKGAFVEIADRLYEISFEPGPLFGGDGVLAVAVFDHAAQHIVIDSRADASLAIAAFISTVRSILAMHGRTSRVGVCPPAPKMVLRDP